MGGAISDPIEGDVIPRYIASGDGVAPGAPRWAAAIRSLLRELSTIVFDDNRNPTGPRAAAAMKAVTWLVAQSQQHPDLFNTVYEEAGIELGMGDGSVTPFPTLGEILGDAGAPPELQDITDEVERTVDQTRTETTEATETTDTTISETRDVFLEVMTPEEFLDDFRTGVSTYAESLYNSGAIDATTRRFLMDNPNVFLGPYLGRLGEMADAGENIFENVGTDFELIPIEQIGERIGPELVREITSTVERIESGELTIEELTEQVQERLLSGTSDPDQQQTIRETINEIFNQSSTSTTTEESVANLLQLTTERIFQQPKLGTVFAISPLEHLRERYTPEGLSILSSTYAGQQQHQQQFAGGVAPSRPRRLA